MEHHIAQSSPISPRQKGMEGSRQALLYGVYDAFAGARTLISKRLCALITAIGIAVLTISSSAWATHPALNTESAPFDDIDGVQLQPNSVHTDDLEPDAVTSDKIGAGEVCGSVATTDCTTPMEADIGAGSIGTDDLAEVDTAGPEEGQNGAVGTTNINDGAVTNDKLAEVVGNTGTGGAVDTANINDDAVTADKLANGAVVGGSGGDIMDGSITSNDLQVVDPSDLPNSPGAVGNGNIQGDAVDSRTLGTGVVCGSVPVAGVDCDGDGTNGDGMTVEKTHIAPGSIGAGDLADGAVTTDEIEDGTITSDDLKSVDGPGTTEGQNGAVSTDKINTDAIDSRTIATGAVGNDELAEVNDLNGAPMTNPGLGGAVNNLNINNEAIDSRTIEDGSVETVDLADGAVTSDKIGGGQVCGSADTAFCQGTDPDHISAGSIDTNDLASQAVTNDKLKQVESTGGPNDGTNGAVSTNNINNEAVTTRTIDDEAVTTDKLANVDTSGTEVGENGAVNTDNINNEAVTTRTIDDEAVTTGKIDNEAVTTGKIDNQAVTTQKLRQVDDNGINGAVNTNNINDDAVTGRKILDRSITESKIQINAVQERHIANRQVIGRHIDDNAIGLRHLNEDVNNVFRRIEGDIDRLDEGIAMSHAISMIKVPQGKEFGISFAGGFYQDKQAAAIGVGFRPTDGLLLSAGASYGFDSEEIGGAVSINFGF